MSGIYKITNLLNNKVYIGQSWDIPKRLKDHFSLNQKNSHLKSAIKKYGKEKFETEIIKEANNQQNLDKWEVFYIEKYNSLDQNFGYNKKTGGLSGKPNQKTKDKMSQVQKQHWSTLEGKIQAKQQSKRMSRRMKQHWSNPKHTQHQKNIQHKLWENPLYQKERDVKHSKNLKEYFQTPEGKVQAKKHSKSQKEYFSNPEARKKAGEWIKQYWTSQEARKQQSERKKKYLQTPEGKINLLKGMIKRYTKVNKWKTIVKLKEKLAEHQKQVN